MKSERLARDAWRDGGRLLVRMRSYVEQARSSMFTVPLFWILGAIVLSQAISWIDVRSSRSDSLPSFLDTTVESARAILSAISSGTIGAASVVFSLTLVAIQLSSSVYTSRVLRSFLRDRFQQNMIGILLATFTYSLLVLRQVRGPLDSEGSGGMPYVPRLSVFLAVVFAIAAVFALLASISHTAQTLRASAVTREIVTELVELVDRTFPDLRASVDQQPSAAGTDDPATESVTDRTADDDTDPDRDVVIPPPTGPGAVLTATRRGWVQQISLEAIRDAVDARSTVRLDVSVGEYVGVGTPLLVVWPPPDEHALGHLMSKLRGAFAIGEQRSMQQDIAFGFTMIEDIANKALSPGVNDPNTAAAVVEQLGEVVLAVLEREPLPSTMILDGCRLTRAHVGSYDDTVVAAFNQIRHFARGQPAVQLVLVRTLVAIGDELIRRRRQSESALDALRSMLRYLDADLAPTSTDPTIPVARRLLRAATWYEPAPTER